MRGMVLAIALGFIGGLTSFVWADLPSASAEAALSSVTSYTLEEQQLLDAYESGSLIRLHVLAEDNTPEAQHVKLAVRDAILTAFSNDWQEPDADALFERLQVHVDDMKVVAEATARELGFTGPVSAEVGVLPLPEKCYGQVVLPSGSYRALRITLGKGEGQNWWCVLYPSLCLAVADDDPWRTVPQEENGAGESEDPPKTEVEIVWDTERIVSQWLIWPEI